MGKVVHFEIHVGDMERARKFYGEVFGWKFEDWSAYACVPYWGAKTGDPDAMGIDGALMMRRGPAPQEGQAMNGFACTIGVGDYDETEAKILQRGGKVVIPKHALPGMAWQGYYTDSEANIIAIHQPDPDAK